MAHEITASMLYDIVECPHRLTMDLFGNPAEWGAASLLCQGGGGPKSLTGQTIA